MHLRSLTSRRPSAAIVISSAALFMSLGGVGYAAVTIPDNSVGTNQIKNNAVSYEKIAPNSVGQVRLADNGVSNSKLANESVSYKKIQPGAVGTVRANINQLQARVNSTCAAGSAIGAISNKGTATCNSTLPAEYGTTNNTATVSGPQATISSLTLPAGTTYLAFANPTATVTSGAAAQRVTLTCTLTAGTGTVTRSVVIPTDGTTGDTSTGTIPLQVAGTSGATAVACATGVPSGATPPSTSVTAAINALSTASSN